MAPLELRIIRAERTIWDGHDRVDPEPCSIKAREVKLIHRIVESHSQLPARRVTAELPNEDGCTFISSPEYDVRVFAFFEVIQELTGQVDYTSSPVLMWLSQPDFIERAQYSQLRIVLVWLTRGEHFCGGFWAAQFENGTISKLVDRLKYLGAYERVGRTNMFKIDEKNLILTPIARTTLVEMNIQERRDLQELMKNSFDDVAAAMDEYRLILVGKEVLPSPVVSDRIDLLAVDDEDGTIVVIELKRAKHKLQLLQALSYAAMVSGSQRSDLLKFQGVDSEKVGTLVVDELADRPRLILVAEDFDYQVLKTAQWLGTQSIEVKCVRLTVSEDKESNQRFLSFSVIFPPREIEEEAKLKRISRKEDFVSADWDEFITQIRNEALKHFVENNLSTGQENQFAYKAFHFRIKGGRHFQVWIRPTFALIEQIGRFDQDLMFWSTRLEHASKPREVYGGNRLRFSLLSAEDFVTFTEAVRSDLNDVVWKTKLTELDSRPVV